MHSITLYYTADKHGPTADSSISGPTKSGVLLGQSRADPFEHPPLAFYGDPLPDPDGCPGSDGLLTGDSRILQPETRQTETCSLTNCNLQQPAARGSDSTNLSSSAPLASQVFSLSIWSTSPTIETRRPLLAAITMAESDKYDVLEKIGTLCTFLSRYTVETDKRHTQAMAPSASSERSAARPTA